MRFTTNLAFLAGLILLLAGCGSGSADGAGSTNYGSLPTDRLDTALVERGRAVYQENCLTCHGVDAVGERPGDPAALDATGLPVAPALNGSMHSWHHTDEGLIATILEGSPRNPRMIAWGQSGLTEDDARAVIAYMKSMWGPVQRQCQGPLHMDRSCIERAAGY